MLASRLLEKVLVAQNQWKALPALSHSYSAIGTYSSVDIWNQTYRRPARVWPRDLCRQLCGVVVSHGRKYRLQQPRSLYQRLHLNTLAQPEQVRTAVDDVV